MTPSEMVKVLKGSREEKLRLFNELSSRILEGLPLEDFEIPIYETLKKELTGG